MIPLGFFSGEGVPTPEDFGPGEEGWLERNRRIYRMDDGAGYSQLQTDEAADARVRASE